MKSSHNISAKLECRYRLPSNLILCPVPKYMLVMLHISDHKHYQLLRTRLGLLLSALQVGKVCVDSGDITGLHL